MTINRDSFQQAKEVIFSVKKENINHSLSFPMVLWLSKSTIVNEDHKKYTTSSLGKNRLDTQTE